MNVELLREYTVSETTVLRFINGYKLKVPAGVYYPVAFGVVVDCVNHGCIANEQASWKLGK